MARTDMDPKHPTSTSDIEQLTSRQAIEIARNAEGELDSRVAACLEEALIEISDRMNSHPDSYIFDKDEFAIFNYFRQRFLGDIAERAVDRYWRCTHGGDG